jgi:hypothetical protein
MAGLVQSFVVERDAPLPLEEQLWAALHGLTTLGRNDRLRPGRETDRIEVLVNQFRAIDSLNDP